MCGLGMTVRYIARDPHGGIHIAPDREEAASYCIVVRKRYAIMLENARKPPATLRNQYDLLYSMASGALQTLDAGRWRARIGDTHFNRMRERAGSLLLGAKSFEEYQERMIAGNVRRTEELRSEGYFDRWMAVSWATSFESAEQEGKALALLEENRDVAILEVSEEWYGDTA